jgi:thiol:disulfide interchange protein DsbD
MRFLVLLLLCFTVTAGHAGSFLDTLSSSKTQPDFLPPDQAFVLQIQGLDSQTLAANLKVTPGYYLYRDKISFNIPGNEVKITDIELPEGELKHDPNFGDTYVFHHSFQVKLKLKRSSDAPIHLTLNATYQGCSEKGLCYPSQDKILQIDLPASNLPNASLSLENIATQSNNSALNAPDPKQKIELDTPKNDTSKIAQLFKQGSFWLILTFFFGAGLLLALTPCVFPMIPILSGIIVGRGHKITKIHAFVLSLAYVLGMAITYAAAGIAAGLSGDLISNALQTPWVLGSFSAIFVILSLSMFGFYELQLPSALQSRLSNTSNQLHGGHLSGVFVMGALSAIIMGPCVAAPLAGALLYIGQTHDAVLGGLALFALALGMGAPLLIIGTSAGVLLPKAGAWMDSVKRFFGVLLLALAIWIIQPLLAVSVQMLLWGCLLILCASYLRVLESLPHNARSSHKLIKGIGVIALLLGATYIIGALSGARNLLQPLNAVCSVCKADTGEPLAFSRIKSLSELDEELKLARGKIVIFDFYADWCVACKEMERFTFSDPDVQLKLKSARMLQVDVTGNTPEDKALLKKFGLYGPPGIIFFDAKGQELTDFRVVGYENPELFTKTLLKIGL